MLKIEDLIRNKIVLVTGGTGSIGSEIVKQLLCYDPKSIRVYSRDEYKQSLLKDELKSDNLRFLLGDVRDSERLNRAMEDVNIVFHAAALKRVDSTEYNPIEAVKTNVIGTQNVVTSALDSPTVNRVIFISTDKAVNVTCTMGATKLLAERLITWASFYRKEPTKILSSVRFGNVLNSRGSVIEIWKRQIEKGGPVTITDCDMVRFFMSIPDAVKLVLQAATYSTGGEIFILKMNSTRIMNLAEILIEEYSPKVGYDSKDIKIQITGIGVGEKLNEELFTNDEINRAFHVNNNLSVIIPNNKLKDCKYNKIDTEMDYDLRYMNKEELRNYLKKEKII